ncbi:head completion protein [Burkholderia phage vB_BglM_WTB]
MANPTYDDAAFRAQFPEFADDTAYPPSLIMGYFNTATLFIQGSQWQCAALSGGRLAAALNMLTAHLMTLARQRDPSQQDGNADDQGGYTTSATIGEVSVAKLAPPAKDGWEFWLAQTPYGQMLWGLLQLLAVGGFSLGGLPERNAFRKVGGLFL